MRSRVFRSLQVLKTTPTARPPTWLKELKLPFALVPRLLAILLITTSISFYCVIWSDKHNTQLKEQKKAWQGETINLNL